MLLIRFQGHRPFSSEEEDVFRFLPYKSMAAILVMWPWLLKKKSFPHPREAQYEIWLIGLVVSEDEDV